MSVFGSFIKSKHFQIINYTFWYITNGTNNNSSNLKCISGIQNSSIKWTSGPCVSKFNYNTLF